MAYTQEESYLDSDKGDFLFTLSARKIILYYLGFCTLFLIIHLAFISLVSFFHFLLDHDMAVIENWLYRNAWEMIVASKSLAALITIKALKLNNYFINSLLHILRMDDWKPTRKVLVLILFISVLFYALIMQFSGELINNTKDTDFAYISYIGSGLFYLIDFLVINVLVRNFKVQQKRKFFALTTVLTLCFLFFTKATLPYIDKYYIFLVLHFVTLLLLLFKERKNMINPLLYTLFIIGPFSSIYGLDIVWDNAHSIFSYKESLPVVGISGIWLIGLGYYYKS
jgi:hypothetical protein